MTIVVETAWGQSAVSLPNHISDVLRVMFPSSGIYFWEIEVFTHEGVKANGMVNWGRNANAR